MNYAALAFTALTAHTACTIDSTTVDTSQASATLLARATGNGTTSLEATLFVGESTVELVGDDRLVASFEGMDQEMVREDGAFASSYTTGFPSERADAEFAIKLLRGDRVETTSALTLPAPFEIDPVAETVSRAHQLSVRWSAPGHAGTDTMRWSLFGTCVEAVEASIPAQSIGIEVPAGLLKLAGADVADTCMVTLQLVRERVGALDARYAGGLASAAQQRIITFLSTP